MANPGGGKSIIMVAETVRLFEREPDLLRFVAEEDREQLTQLRVPVVEVERGPCALPVLFAERRAFGAVVLDGLLLHRIRVGHHVAMRVQGPGDIVGRLDDPASPLVLERSTRATDATRLALLGREVLLATQRWPLLAAGLHARLAEQEERLAVQLAICQLPRVDERLLALLWWLAEAWGRVTAAGTIVPLAMTHDVLGALIGARRPTVTLALGELTERGAIVRQDRGWLLLAPPPAAGRAPAEFDDPTLIGAPAGPWVQSGDPAPDRAAAHAELLEAVQRLRVEHGQATIAVKDRLRELLRARETLMARRAELRTRRRAPS